MSPYRNKTPWIVLCVVVVAALAAIGIALWPRTSQPPPALVAVEDPLPPLPKRASTPPKPARTTRKSKPARSNTPSPAPVVVHIAPAPALAPTPAPVVEAAPVPTAAVEPVIDEPMSAPPMVVSEPEDAPLEFDGNGTEIARAIANAKRHEVQQCFERELKHNPTAHGTVNVELDLAPAQKVNNVIVTDDLDSPEFTRCVTAAMQQLAFTGLNEEVTIHVPYALTPRGK